VVMRGAGIPGASMGSAPKCWGGRGGGTAAPGRHVGPRVPRGGRVGNHVVERMAAEAPRRRGTITWSKSSPEGGYTPYETLLERFDELDVVHRCTRVIQAPLSTCMEPWCDWKHVRKFVPQLVDVESIPQEDGRVRRLRMMYRFATTPTIELMTSAVYVGAEPKQQLNDALQQQNEGPGTGQRCKEVRWRSTEGFPQAGYVQFTEREAHKTEREGDPAGPPTETVVELEFTYRMPAVLVEFVGRHPVQVDVEKIVQDSMDRYVELCLKKTHAEQA